MIAEHVAAKAVRDAFFLSTFGPQALPVMLIVAALASIAVIPPLARVLSRHGPNRVVTPAFAVSAVLLAFFAWFAENVPRVAAVAVYLHVAAIHAVLISWFWSLINERFDPRTAKREMRRMMGGATLGGLVGGLVAERAATLTGVGAMLLLLACIHGVCAILIRHLSKATPAVTGAADPSASGWSVLRRSSYAQKLALLVLVSTASATLIDYVFKADAVATLGGGPSLLRFFALFYAVTGLFTFAIQSSLSHVALARLGLAPTVASLPAAVMLAGVGALFFPGLQTFTLLRASEISIRSSLYRSGYELFFTPMSSADKRGLKTVIDVGFDRAGDVLGGGLVKLVLAVAAGAAVNVLLGLAVGLSVMVLVIAVQLHRGYVRTLEQRLRERAVEIDVAEVKDSTTLSVLHRTLRGPLLEPDPLLEPARVQAIVDPLVERITALRSRDAQRVRSALQEGSLSSPLVAQVIPLLAWDEAAPLAIAALAPNADSSAGQLADALLSPDEEFAVRRRIPRVLEMGGSPRAIEALLLGLDDARFEVRYRCGRALARIHARAPEAVIDRDRIFGAVLKEAAIDRGVWESQRLLDEDGPIGDDREFVDELVRDRASRSLEHVFTLLSLAFPRRPLVLAFRGVHTSDDHLRGTALEYLEGVLPPDIRAALWPFLEDRRPAQRPERTREEALEALLLSNDSIQLNLEEARRKIAPA
jgi:hypothetical protein